MTRRIRRRTVRQNLIRSLLASTLLVGVSCHAKTLDVAGTWNGAIQAPAITLRTVLHVTANSAGELSATFDSLDQNQMAIPCANVALKGTTFTFEIPVARGTYQGTLSADGTAIDGIWNRGRPTPLRFAREGGPAPKGSAASGDWSGAIKVPARTLNLALHVKAGSDGQLTVALDSLDQGAMGLPGSNAVLNGNDFSFQIPSVHGSYEGTVSADGKAMKGSWTQGTTLPLDFTKAS
jgi:D-alanyl-D-alanine-carboxypeptidase/D-alanyl-D-alanine-endopeptidase